MKWFGTWHGELFQPSRNQFILQWRRLLRAISQRNHRDTATLEPGDSKLGSKGFAGMLSLQTFYYYYYYEDFGLFFLEYLF